MRGPTLPPSATQHRPELAGAPFEAMGVSLVMHPRNPHVPTVHMNVRMLRRAARGPRAGELVRRRHGPDALLRLRGRRATFPPRCRDALAPFGADKYPRFKHWCDEYFFLKHRNEARGIGGVFFDDFAELGFERSFAMMRAVGDAFVGAYLPIVQRRRATPYGEREREFQLYRRGRYVEFNLVFDRGTHFGLQSGGRTESILMSMPPMVKWRYDWTPEPGSAEARLYSDFLPRAGLAGLSFEPDERRIGLFGGSLDPVHNAHLALGRQALAELPLDELRWVPAGQPWQKAPPMTPAPHREACCSGDGRRAALRSRTLRAGAPRSELHPGHGARAAGP